MASVDSGEALSTEHHNKGELLSWLGDDATRSDQASDSFGTRDRPNKRHLDYFYLLIQTMNGV